MEIKTLYKYTRIDGGISVSPVIPDVEYAEMFRLIADDGKLLTKDGENMTSCVDTDSTEGWYEVEDTDTLLEEENTGAELS